MLHNYNIPESIFLQIIHENGGDQMGENLRKIEDCFLKFAFSKIKKIPSSSSFYRSASEDKIILDHKSIYVE